MLNLETNPTTKQISFKKWMISTTIFIASVFLLYAKTQGWVQKSEKAEFQDQTNICRSKECRILGRKMKSLMNPKIDPCNDFFESVCGNYPNNNTMFESWNHFEDDMVDFDKVFMKYEPVTKSEKIAKKLFEKCMRNTKYRNRIDMSFWDDLEKHSLTDVLIEATKTNPIDTGFLKNFVYTVNVGGMRLTLMVSNGVEKNSSLESIANQIFEKNDSLKTPDYIRWDLTTKQIHFIDLKKYFSELVPLENRNENKDTEYYVDVNGLSVLQKVVEIVGEKTVKEVLRDKYLSTMKSHLVEPEFLPCMDKTTQIFPGTLAKIFVNKLVGKRNYERGYRLFSELQQVFIEMLDENTWLNKQMKEVLKKEVLEMKTSIGIPDEHKDQQNVDRMYSQIGDFENQSYLELIRNLLKMNSEETFLRVARKEKMTFFGGTLQFNANYQGLSHRTSISPIFLNFPYIDENLPEWNIFASLGYVLGHEIGHSFDSQNFFDNSSLEKIKMSTKLKEIFNERIKCVIQKYNKFQFPDGTLSNGTFTQQEDSADMIGFNLAYRLFKKLNNNEKLPGLEKYTVEQQYFQRLGYVWCKGDMDKEYIDERKKDIHSALKFRVNGMMSNFEEFAKAFKCPKNSPMNPEKKCPLFK